ncbi:MAG: hypothetical protein M3Q11_03675 [Pseudomonadota bacterium]|nr:hypothetical protein [Pseudomonadota bacterium]
MTPTNAFPWPGWTPQKTLILPIPHDLWPPPSSPVSLDGITFQPKHELHVTLVGRGLGQALHGEPGRRGFRVQTVREAFARQDWSFERSGHFLRLEKRELAGRGRSIGSIVEHVRMPALARFYDELADLLGRKLAIPPPHVTLYTVGRSQGIAVPDVATLQRLAMREVSAHELPAEAVEPSRAWRGR